MELGWKYLSVGDQQALNTSTKVLDEVKSLPDEVTMSTTTLVYQAKTVYLWICLLVFPNSKKNLKGGKLVSDGSFSFGEWTVSNSTCEGYCGWDNTKGVVV